MESGLGKVLSYVGSFFIGAGMFIGFIFLGAIWISAPVMLFGLSLGLIMLGLSKVIAQQEEILKMGAAASGHEGTNGDGTDGSGTNTLEG